MSEVKVEIKADGSALATGLAKAQKNIQNFGKDVTTSITDKLAGAFSAAGVIGGIGVLAAGIMSAGKSILDFAGNLQDSSDAIGVTTDALQGLNAVFLAGGSNAETTQKGLITLTRSLQDIATTADGPARKALDALGISFESIAGLTADEALYVIADAMKNASDHGAALDAAMTLLGKAGAKMAPALFGGAEAMREMAKQSPKISAEDIKSIADAGDMIDALGTSIKVYGANAVLGVAKSKAFWTSLRVSTAMLTGGVSEAIRALSKLYDSFNAPKKKTEAEEAKVATQSAESTAIDPRIAIEAEAAAKDLAERTKLSEEYAAKKEAAAKKIADIQEKNASDALDTLRSQLTEEQQINKLIEDRMHLEMEVANTRGEQQALAQKDLQDVQKLIAAKTEALANDGRAKAKEQMAMDAENLADAQAKGAADIAGANKTFMAKQMDIVGKMADEELKTPMQRANEDRVAREKERVEASIKRRIERGTMSGMSSKAMGKLQNELIENAKNLPDEVAKLTKEMQTVVDKINKG
ncbi:MAG: hypothetical protein EBY29_09160 [Planctomycetes bacterium]|nr:hypothetical protein [Planctomycetota bacterium]